MSVVKGPHGSEVKVFAASAALNLGLGRNRADTDAVGNLQIARKAVGREGYDWESAINFQIGPGEIPNLLAVCLGRLPAAKLEHRGKVLRLGLSSVIAAGRSAATGSHVITLRTTEPDSARAVPLAPNDRLDIAITLFRAMMKNSGGVSQEVLYRMLEAVYESPKPTLEVSAEPHASVSGTS